MTKSLMLFTLAAASMQVASAQQYVIDLKSSSAPAVPAPLGNAITVENWSPLPASGTGSVQGCAAGWYRARLKLDLNAAQAKQARIVVEYEGQPQGWTSHIAGAPNTDGYGGGDADAAEMHITSFDNNDDRLLVYSRPFFGQGVEKLLERQVSVRDGAAKFIVANQKVSFGQPFETLESPFSKTLFTIDPNGDGTIYAAFNRVVSGRTDRNGCGARRVLISFQ
jgi:hypothetical protein